MTFALVSPENLALRLTSFLDLGKFSNWTEKDLVTFWTQLICGSQGGWGKQRLSIYEYIYIYTYWYDLICAVCVCIYIYTKLYQSCWWYKSNEKCCKQINIYQPSRAGAGTLWFSHQGDPIETSLATIGDGDEWDGAWDPIDVPEPWRKTMVFSPWGNWSAWLRPYRWTAGYQQLFLVRKKICFSQMIQIQSNK